MKKSGSKKTQKKQKAIEEGTKELKAASSEKNNISWRENKNVLAGLALVLLIIVVIVFFSFYSGSGGVDENTVNMSLVKDIGAVKVRGDGLPGYDINRDGEVDYLSVGFGYYKGLYETGGFEYGPGGIELEEFGIDLTLPVLYFKPNDIVESSVGSVVSFAAENESVSVTIIYKTLGPALSTYNVFIKGVDGNSYGIIDAIDSNKSGTIEEREVEIMGRMVIRE